MENKKKPKAIDILKEALDVFANNPNFIFFTALASLPLFFFSLHFQNLWIGYNETFVSTAHYSMNQSQKNHSLFDWSLPIDIVRNLRSNQFGKLLHLGFLYLAPFNLLQLVTVILIVDLASKLYREEKALTFKDMLAIRLNRERLQGTFVTFLYVMVFSNCTLIGFVWLLLTYSTLLTYFPSESGFYPYHYIESLQRDICILIMYGSNLVLLFGIYLGWGAIWNLGLVISVLEGKYGTKALGSSGYLCLRNAHNGMILMLVFSIWELGSWIPSFFSFGGYKTWTVIVAQSGLFCFGNALKWVGFVVYLESCVKRLSVKKNDVEEEG